LSEHTERRVQREIIAEAAIVTRHESWLVMAQR